MLLQISQIAFSCSAPQSSQSPSSVDFGSWVLSFSVACVHLRWLRRIMIYLSTIPVQSSWVPWIPVLVLAHVCSRLSSSRPPPPHLDPLRVSCIQPESAIFGRSFGLLSSRRMPLCKTVLAVRGPRGVKTIDYRYWRSAAREEHPRSSQSLTPHTWLIVCNPRWCRCCCLHIKPFFLPNDISSTLGVHPVSAVTLYRTYS